MKIIKANNINKNILDIVQKFVKETDDDWNYITPEDLNESNLNKFYILDVRKKEDYETR